MWYDEDENSIPYKIKSQLDEINLSIHQISKETGLALVPFIIEKDGFKAVSLRQVYEGLDSTDIEKRYDYYSWHEIPYLDLKCYLLDLSRDLRSSYLERQEQLPSFQQAWYRVKNHGDGVEVHFGLRTATVTIPLETLVKYQMYIKNGTFETLYFDSEQNQLILRYAYKYQIRGCNALDDRATYLEWKVDEYCKAQKARTELVELSATLRSFSYWENQTFPALAASS